MVEIEGRRDATSRTGKVRAHVQALADNLDPVLAISTDEQVMRVWRAWGAASVASSLIAGLDAGTCAPW